MLAIIHNPRLLAAFLATITAMVVVTVFIVVSNSGGGAQKTAYTIENESGVSVYLMDDPDAAPVALVGGLVDVVQLERSPRGGETAVLASTVDGPVVVRLSDDTDTPATTVNAPGSPRGFAWSPDGKELAVSTVATDGSYFIYITKDGKPPRALLAGSSSEPSLGGWSPKKDWFAYALGGESATSGVYIKNPDGVNVLRLTSGEDSLPTWSPDGERIAFVSRGNDGNERIMVMNGDGSEPVGLADVSGEELVHDWAPDSTRIAFVSNQEIHTIGIDGQDLRQLTVNATRESGPRWSNDGSEILFASDTNGDFDLFVMDSNGLSQRRLTESGQAERLADW